MTRSLAETVAALSPSQRDDALRGLDPDELLWDWGFWGRPEQKPPPDDSWSVWLYMAGRGAGKSRSAAEWVRERARTPDLRIGLVARTAADVRDVIIEGESGIINVTPPSERPTFHPSRRTLSWPNGTSALCFSADEPDQLRGPQFHCAWADEAAAWRQIPDAAGMTAWDNLRIATRLGPRKPQIAVTTTPKRVPLMRSLLAEANSPTSTVYVTQGSTLDNAGNLPASYMDAILGVYGGTRLARQELEGLMLDDVEGALWIQRMIDAFRVPHLSTPLPLRVVGVDPTVAERPGDECGIVVCAASSHPDLYRRNAWVLDDASLSGSPEMWANRVVQTARRWGAPVIAETNQGGALVRHAIHSVDPGVPVLEVHSKFGKQLRAEPISLCYEQGRVHHLGVLADLESQMVSWVPGEGHSPDRVDALVHALTALLIKPPPGLSGGHLTAHSLASRRISPPSLLTPSLASSPSRHRSRAARVLIPSPLSSRPPRR